MKDMPYPRRVVVLGSTGSIGRNAVLELLEHKEEFQVVGLVTGFEIQSRDRYDGGLERVLTQGETGLTVISEHCDIR